MTNYGFVIDNRKCIGCHACTTACKSEHDVPIGVNRTWVKYIEKGKYPNTRRLFSVMRCNHCENAPCVDICPVTALFTRGDGIVDFDHSRCIACKACMQACPYDALYIDPETKTSAKCNYCTNRVELGLEPACVVVCPEQAIIPGDLDDPNSKISLLISQEIVTVRKPEKGTVPNVFYIDGDSLMLTPSMSSDQGSYMWSSQDKGVGHYAGKEFSASSFESQSSINATNVYDTPDKGRLWDWQVPSYLFTKSIASGIGMIIALIFLFDVTLTLAIFRTGMLIILLSLAATAAFLVMDLDQPKRFYTLLLRPNWTSWLAKGAYIITFYGLFVTIVLGYAIFSKVPIDLLNVLLFVFGLLSAIYTAFLFAQAKGRDFWQSSTLPLDMMVHSFLTGSAVLMLLQYMGMKSTDQLDDIVRWIFVSASIATLVLAMVEITIYHPTHDAEMVVDMLKSGKWARQFWLGVVLAGLVPLFVLLDVSVLEGILPILALIGVFLLNKVWVYAPQGVKLS